jgi:hypothetical protein
MSQQNQKDEKKEEKRRKSSYSGWGVFSDIANFTKGLGGDVKNLIDLNTKGYVSTPKKTTPKQTVPSMPKLSKPMPMFGGVYPNRGYSPVTVDELLGLGDTGPVPAAGTEGYTGETVEGGMSFQDILREFGIGSGGSGGSSGRMTAKEQFELEQAKAQQRALNRYARGIQSMLDSGSYRTAQDDLLNTLTQQYQSATPTINSAVDALRSVISSQENPYLNAQATVTQVDPQLEQFLQSQGVSTEPLAGYAATLQAERQARADAYNRLNESMRTNYETQRNAQTTGAEAMRTALLGALENSRTGYGAQIESQATQERKGLEQMLLDAISKGANPNKKNKKNRNKK